MACYWRMEKGRGGERSLWHQLQRGEGLLVGRLSNQSEYTRGKTSALPPFTLTWLTSSLVVSDMLSLAAADTDYDRANVTTWEMKGAQREDILRAEKQR